MKHYIMTPNLEKEYQEANAAARREQILLAFEAEYDINRPFDVEWCNNDEYFVYDKDLYIYKPQHGARSKEIVAIADKELLSESPHFYQYKI